MASNERAIINNLNERARHYGGSDAPQLTIYDVRAILDFYERTCLKCGNTPATSIDHVKPLSKGGENSLQNAQVLCVNCNKAKGDEEIDYRQGKVCPADFTAPTAQEKTYKKHDWDEIEADYIYSDLSMREIAKKYSVSLRQLGGFAAENDWITKRRNISNKIATEIRKDIEALNIADGFSTYKAFYLSMRRAFDDYLAFPDPEKLRALNDLYGKGLVMENHEIDKRSLVVKDWRDAAVKNGEHADDIQQFATDAAGDYYSSDSPSDREAGAGWSD
jgi:hypothetical protein